MGLKNNNILMIRHSSFLIIHTFHSIMHYTSLSKGIVYLERISFVPYLLLFSQLGFFLLILVLVAQYPQMCRVLCLCSSEAVKRINWQSLSTVEWDMEPAF